MRTTTLLAKIHLRPPPLFAVRSLVLSDASLLLIQASVFQVPFFFDVPRWRKFNQFERSLY